MADPSHDRHLAYMRQALALARQSPPQPSNFRVGALLVDAGTGAVLAGGYTLELPGNTHAEQCCLQKLAARHGVPEEGLPGLGAEQLPRRLALYTTMEPCSFRLSGNLPCVQRVLRLASAPASAGGGGAAPVAPVAPVAREVTVYAGVTEPDTFVAQNTGRQTLAAAGIRFVHVPGLEDEILAVATAGHQTEGAAGQ